MLLILIMKDRVQYELNYISCQFLVSKFRLRMSGSNFILYQNLPAHCLIRILLLRHINIIFLDIGYILNKVFMSRKSVIQYVPYFLKNKTEGFYFFKIIIANKTGRKNTLNEPISE